jgi:hypothetical protein
LNSPLNYGTPTSISTPRTSGIASATPLRQRSDINADRNLRQINIPPVCNTFVMYIHYEDEILVIFKFIVNKLFRVEMKMDHIF